MLAYMKQPKLHPLFQCLLCTNTLRNVSQGTSSAPNSPHPAHTQPLTSYSEQMHNRGSAEGVMYCEHLQCDRQSFVRVAVRKM